MDSFHHSPVDQVMLATAAISLIIVCSLTFGGAWKPSCNVTDVTSMMIHQIWPGIFWSIPVNMANSWEKRLGLGLSDLMFLRSPRNWWDLAGFIVCSTLKYYPTHTHVFNLSDNKSEIWRNRLAGIWGHDQIQLFLVWFRHQLLLPLVLLDRPGRLVFSGSSLKARPGVTSSSRWK